MKTYITAGVILGGLLISSCKQDDAADFAWMIRYWENNANDLSLPREDAARMAKACLEHDKNPRTRFAELVECSATYGSIVGRVFHAYDANRRMLTDSDMLQESGDWYRLRELMYAQGDNPNAHFLERVALGREGSD